MELHQLKIAKRRLVHVPGPGTRLFAPLGATSRATSLSKTPLGVSILTDNEI